MTCSLDLDDVPVPMMVVDRGTVREANAEACRMLGRDRAWLVGREAANLLDEVDAEMLALALGGGVLDRLVVRLVPELGGTSLELQLSRQRDTGVVVALRDVTELLSARRRAEDLQAELRYLATHDVLTGVPNRSLLRDRIDQALRRSRRFGFRFAILFCDLDGFKAINDRYGHDAGDRVLIETARRIERVLGEHGGTVARFGGDEFVVLYEGDDDPCVVGTFASRLIESIVVPIEHDGAMLSVGTSIGLAIPDGHGTVDSLIGAADAAMYAAKLRGKGCWEIAGRASGDRRGEAA